MLLVLSFLVSHVSAAMQWDEKHTRICSFIDLEQIGHLSPNATTYQA